MAAPLHFCSFESRPKHLIGLKLLVRSLAVQAPEAVLHIVRPSADATFEAWARSHHPNVRLHVFQPEARKWAVKPEVLLHLLDEGRPELVWLDSDILAIHDPRPLFAGLDPDTLVTAQEFNRTFDPDSGRTSVWGHDVVRKLEYSVNSCVLRVTTRHRELLERWRAYVLSPLFQEAQQRTHSHRPPALYSDQDVLEGLLASDAPGAFDRIPVRQLRTGREIIQDHLIYTYRLADRLRNALGIYRAPLVHCQSFKPWTAEDAFHASVFELSPYVHHARRFRDALTREEAEPWMTHASAAGRFWRSVTLDSAHLKGVGLMVLDKLDRLPRPT